MMYAEFSLIPTELEFACLSGLVLIKRQPQYGLESLTISLNGKYKTFNDFDNGSKAWSNCTCKCIYIGMNRPRTS